MNFYEAYSSAPNFQKDGKVLGPAIVIKDEAEGIDLGRTQIAEMYGTEVKYQRSVEIPEEEK